MDEEKYQEVQQWLIKSQHDLEAARLLFSSQSSLLDVAAYHCQQSVEKALKGYLTCQDVVFPKTHNLSSLLGYCASYNPQFNNFLEIGETLTPYATEFRYPGEVMEPESKEVEEAIIMAETVINFIHQSLQEMP